MRISFRFFDPRVLVLTVLISVLFLFYCGQNSSRVPSSGSDEKETDPKVSERLEEFQDWKFGLFVHWGPCSQWGARIAWPLSEWGDWARPDDLEPWIESGKDFEKFTRRYMDLNKTFNPEEFNPEEWAGAAKHAGMKYIIFVTKCHDGFAMFHTEQTPYSITDPSCPFHTNPNANVTKAVLDAFRQEGQVRLTRKGDAVYLIYLAKKAQTRPPAEVIVSSIRPAEGAEVTLLGKDIRLEWEKKGNGAVIFIPDYISNRLRGEHPVCRHAWTIKISKAQF